jgi:hypothetical protein
MVQTSANTAICCRSANVFLAGLEGFFLFGVVLGHFFGLFPSVPMVTPRTPGAVIIFAPVTALKKKYMTPGPSIWPF